MQIGYDFTPSHGLNSRDFVWKNKTNVLGAIFEHDISFVIGEREEKVECFGSLWIYSIDDFFRTIFTSGKIKDTRGCKNKKSFAGF